MSTTKKIPVVKKELLFPFIIITSLFALWGIANDLTNPMVSAFKKVMPELSNMQASLVQFAFYFGYFFMALPAALFIRKKSYKSGIILGLSLYAIGAFLFYPAASNGEFTYFLISLWIITCGLAFLETTSNPLILSLGDKETATQRLNLAQAFNPIGSLTGMIIAQILVISTLQSDKDFGVKLAQNIDSSTQTIQVINDNNILDNYNKDGGYIQIDNELISYTKINSLTSSFEGCERGLKGNITAKDKDNNVQFVKRETKATKHGKDIKLIIAHSDKILGEIKTNDLGIISKPYLGLGVLVIIILIIILFTKIPKIPLEDKMGLKESFNKLFANKNYVQGVIAQAFYVGAQIMCWTYIYQYVDNLNLNLAENAQLTATWFNVAAMIIFLSGRWIGTILMKTINPSKLLFLFGIGGVVFTAGAILIPGELGLYSLVAVSLFMSIMFPTIYGIALKNMGDEAKIGSAGLVMAIVGGALMPVLQGSILDWGGSGFADVQILGYIPEVNFSFILPLICLAVVANYGYKTYKRNI